MERAIIAGPLGRHVAALLDPAKDAARVRAMYTSAALARRGVGRLILPLCEDAARAEGFTRAELVATMAGEPLYRARLSGDQEVRRRPRRDGGASGAEEQGDKSG
jgi:GNAT superfamily N-acetyltransferase